MNTGLCAGCGRAERVSDDGARERPQSRPEIRQWCVRARVRLENDGDLFHDTCARLAKRRAMLRRAS